MLTPTVIDKWWKSTEWQSKFMEKKSYLTRSTPASNMSWTPNCKNELDLSGHDFGTIYSKILQNWKISHTRSSLQVIWRSSHFTWLTPKSNWMFPDPYCTHSQHVTNICPQISAITLACRNMNAYACMYLKIHTAKWFNYFLVTEAKIMHTWSWLLTDILKRQDQQQQKLMH